MKVEPLPSTFELFSLDKLTIYHFVFWSLILLLILYLVYNIKELQALRLKNKITLCFFAFAILSSFFIGSKYNPEGYWIRNDNINENYEKQSALNDGFTIEAYSMKLKLEDMVSNDCSMDIVINKSGLNKLDLSLYHTLKPLNIKVNGKEVKFSNKDDELTVLLAEKYKEGEKIKVSVKYTGIINTVDKQGMRRYFVNSHSLFLADYFPWYPKPEFMGNAKKYEIKVESNNGDIYSNLSEKNNIFEGEGKEIFFMKSNLISKHLYKGMEFIGNTEQIATDIQCEDFENTIKKDYNINNLKRLIVTPQRDKEYLLYNLYDDQVLFGQFDSQSVLQYRR
ncbi:MAG: hypothetical protein Q8936_02520 [Bacillota bacterium]|nr:hypothetical protein [Bacillota bacterium]